MRKRLSVLQLEVNGLAQCVQAFWRAYEFGESPNGSRRKLADRQ
jgi:hypothetical protein